MARKKTPQEKSLEARLRMTESALRIVAEERDQLKARLYQLGEILRPYICPDDEEED